MFGLLANSQNTTNKKYGLGVLFSSEFYNADFNELNELLDSREILGSSLGLFLYGKEKGSYATLEYQIIRNYSDDLSLKGNAIYLSINHNILKAGRHMLYPKLNVLVANYDIEAREDLNLLNNGDRLTSNCPFYIGVGTGYEFLYKINFIKALRNKTISMGINFDKLFSVSDLKWDLDGSNIDFFDIGLSSGIRTKVVVRVIF